MADVLTESFCERCGSRYTFESAAPKVRMRRLRVMSRGLKTFVLDDKTSLDEALASAKSDVDRDQASSQLDAFHQTFNFCMQCRQYTCPKCWNEVEGRCLTCAPDLGHEILPAPFPGLDLTRGVISAGPPAVLSPAPETTNGHAGNGVADDRHAENGHEDGGGALDALARLDALTMVAPAEPVVEAERVVEAEPATPEPVSEADGFAAAEAASHIEMVGAEVDAAAEPEPVEEATATPEPVVEAVAEVVPDPEPVVETTVEPEAIVEIVAPAEPEPVAEIAADEPIADDTAARAAELSERTRQLLAGLRPGQNIDAALAAFESVANGAAPEAEPEPVAAAVAEPEPVVEPAVEAVAAPALEPTPEPLAAATVPAAGPDPVAAAEPIAASPIVDDIAQPTWTVPTPVDAPAVQPPTGPATEAPALPAAATAEPAWPTQPQWPAQRPSPGLPFLDRPAVPTGGVDALWAASDLEVTAPAGSKPSTGVQPCISCGLSLSATARFCRRCGRSQVG